MCDYSLMHVKSRPASVGDKLRTSNFGTGTRGFAAPSDPGTAVCVLPGTELAFNSEIAVYGASTPIRHKTAIFRQINRDQPHMHHDALELPDGQTLLLTFLCEGQEATAEAVAQWVRNDLGLAMAELDSPPVAVTNRSAPAVRPKVARTMASQWSRRSRAPAL